MPSPGPRLLPNFTSSFLALGYRREEREGGIISFHFSPQDPLTNTLMVLLISGLRLLSLLDASGQQRWECRG